MKLTLFNDQGAEIDMGDVIVTSIDIKHDVNWYGQQSKFEFQPQDMTVTVQFKTTPHEMYTLQDKLLQSMPATYTFPTEPTRTPINKYTRMLDL